MLEMMLGSAGESKPDLLKLVDLSYSGTPPVGWNGYSNAMVYDPYRSRIALHGPSDGLLYPFDLASNTFATADPANRSNSLRMGTRFAETSPMGGAAFKWGINGSSYQSDMKYVNSDLKFYTASTWANNTSYHNQCTIGTNAYFFGGAYGTTVMGLNNMAVYMWNLNGTTLAAHGSVTLAPLTHNAYIGHDDVSIFIFGGTTSNSSGSSLTKEVWRYLLAQKIWQKVSDCPFSGLTGGMNTPFYDGKFWFLGATTTNSSVLNGQLWSYKVYDATWKLEATYPELNNYRTGQLFIYNDTLYYFFPQIGSAATTTIFTIRLA